MSEIPVHSRPRRLVDWINPTGTKKVHSLIDKVYKRKNLEMAWESVHANRGSGGVDGQTLSGFAERLDQQLNRLQSELRISERAIDEGRPAQGVEGDTKRERVDRRRRPERLFWVCGSRETSNAGCPASSGNAQSGKLR